MGFYSIKIRQGESFPPLNVKHQTSAAADYTVFTGGTALCEIRINPEDEPEDDAILTFTTSDNTLTFADSGTSIRFSPVDTSGISPGVYVYSLTWTDTGAVVRQLLEGTFELEPWED